MFDPTFGTMTDVSPLTLTDRVGVRGRNVPSDVIRVQDALNTIPVHEGAPAKLLTLDGVAGPKTCNAIQQFQLRHFGWKIADGRVDPGGKTEEMLASLLAIYGTATWNIKRIESATPATGNVVRTIHSPDRFFVIGDPAGVRRAIYYFLPIEDLAPPRSDQVPVIQEDPEFNMFQTAANCGVFSFVGDGTYSEYSPTSGSASIQLTVVPVCTHIAAGPLILQIRHNWLEPMTTPGVRFDMTGSLAFVRDESQGIGARKTRR